jgi:site-specific DNA recombinase
MRAIIYARVSTDEQGDNFSLPSQIDACRTYATERGMQVVAELQDVQSGAVLERPGLARARELARQRQIDAVIVYSLDRLSRNVAHTLLLRDELTEAGVTLHTCTRGQASDTPEGRMFDTLESAFAEYERLKIRERMMRGKRQKAANGQVVGEGAAPYGYRLEGSKRDRRLVIVPEEAEIVKMIYCWRVIDGTSVCEIARRLNDMGAPPPSVVNPHSIGAYRRKHADACWTKNTVNRILANPTYAGSVAQYDAIVTTPAIIDQETFELARIAAQRAKEQARRNTKHSYLLRGRVRCAVSGYAMCGHSSAKDGRTYRYYRAQKPGGRALNTCLWETRAEPLEQAVWQWVVSLLDETTIREAISAARAADADRQAEYDRRRTAIIDAIERLRGQVDRLIDAYTQGVIDREELARQAEPRRSQMKALQQELDALTASASAITEETETLLIETARQIREDLATNVDDDVRRAIIDAMDVRVTLERCDDGSIVAHAQASLPVASAVVCVTNTYSLARVHATNINRFTFSTTITITKRAA